MLRTVIKLIGSRTSLARHQYSWPEVFVCVPVCLSVCLSYVYEYFCFTVYCLFACFYHQISIFPVTTWLMHSILCALIKGTLRHLVLCPHKLDYILYTIKLEGWAELQAKLDIRV